MCVTAVNNENGCLKENITWVAISALVQLSNRIYLNMFQQGRVVFLGNNLHFNRILRGK